MPRLIPRLVRVSEEAFNLYLHRKRRVELVGGLYHDATTWERRQRVSHVWTTAERLLRRSVDDMTRTDGFVTD